MVLKMVVVMEAGDYSDNGFRYPTMMDDGEEVGDDVEVDANDDIDDDWG